MKEMVLCETGRWWLMHTEDWFLLMKIEYQSSNWMWFACFATDRIWENKITKILELPAIRENILRVLSVAKHSLYTLTQFIWAPFSEKHIKSVVDKLITEGLIMRLPIPAADFYAIVSKKTPSLGVLKFLAGRLRIELRSRTLEIPYTNRCTTTPMCSVLGHCRKSMRKNKSSSGACLFFWEYDTMRTCFDSYLHFFESQDQHIITW